MSDRYRIILVPNSGWDALVYVEIIIRFSNIYCRFVKIMASPVIEMSSYGYYVRLVHATDL